MSISRRGFISGGAATAAGLALPRVADARALVNSAVGGFITDPTSKPSIAWPVGLDIRDFGAKGDGVTDDTAAIQAAINACRLTGGTVHFPVGVYLVTASLDVTLASGDPLHGMTFAGNGCPQSDSNVTTGPLIHAKHTGHVFDCSGRRDIWWENIGIFGDATTTPQTGWFMARNAAGSGAGRHRFLNCRTVGSFSKAYVYNYAAEEVTFIACDFVNAKANVDGMVTTSYNILSLSSTFITIATGIQSMTVVDIQGGSHQVTGGTGTVFRLDGVTGMWMRGCWMFAGSKTTAGLALVFLDGTNSASGAIVMDQCIGENATHLQTYGLYAANGTRTWVGITVRDCRWATGTYAIYGDNSQTFDGLTVEQLVERASRGISVLNFRDSYFRGANNVVVVRGTSTKSVLIGNAVNWTIAARSTDIWLDTLTGTINLNGLRVEEGMSAPTMGAVALVAGRKVVATTKVTASSRILLTTQIPGGTPGWLQVSTRAAGTSFTITSSSGSDTSTVAWLLLEPG